VISGPPFNMMMCPLPLVKCSLPPSSYFTGLVLNCKTFNLHLIIDHGLDVFIHVRVPQSSFLFFSFFFVFFSFFGMNVSD